MPDTLEDRVADLERLVLRQAEKLAALEERLDVAQQLATARIVRQFRSHEEEAA